jgi:hypothetical protein
MWVLILCLVYGGQASMTSSEFDDEAACNAAAARMAERASASVANLLGDRARTVYVCAPRGSGASRK